ncbi:uncharacterized protein ColSpa_11830 [Colletotrichum spaethianum]|uniref:Heterokaryon incompatibility protein n=1 Tax=Colletotrichum spaethianum TaxID=700344 RepID=A0AA37PG70_9PEZI|nr:uncharacterized protein ColSpa_11830 [Colletotrichum spaethianum]GKT51649.1 hypothetical protein ColSpa_11830 [Colletotrichum spaethianum]
MKRINFSPQQRHQLRSFRVPSWSWMAYEGAITFMELPFDAVLWERDEIRSPWWPPRDASNSSWLSISSNGGRIELTGTARDFDLVRGDQRIFYDGLSRPQDLTVKCVTVGRRKSEAATDAMSQQYFVLVVAQKSHSEDGAVYERVGWAPSLVVGS